MLDDFDCPRTKIQEHVVTFLAGISAVGEQVAQPREQRVDGFDHLNRDNGRRCANEGGGYSPE